MQANVIRRTLTAAAFGLLALPLGWAQEQAPGIIGQNNWLYYRNELLTAADQPGVSASVDLLRRINRVLQRNGVQLVVAMAPIKIRIHSENLPAQMPLDAFQKKNYDVILQSLRSGGIKAVDVNAAFLASPQRVSPMPLYFRLDTHWSSSGALLAAETIAKAVKGDPSLNAALDTVPVTPFTLTWSDKDWPVAGDLTLQLPKGTPPYDKEMIKIFQVQKVGGDTGGLLGAGSQGAITLLGSSYSADWTNFPVAMRYALQRDLLSISVDALQGQWVGLHTYLRDDAYQTNKPKLLIWEMPERDMRSPPDMKYREAKYVMDNTEWLLQASAYAQDGCLPSAVQVKTAAAGMPRAKQTADGVNAGATAAEEFIELTLDKPLDKTTYLSARLATTGSIFVSLEGSGAGSRTRKFSHKVAGDDGEHNFRVPLLPVGGGQGFTKVRLYPGKTNGFSIQNIQVCRQPDELFTP